MDTMTITQRPKPPLGKIKLLHQAWEGEDACLYCGKPIAEWGSMEECEARTDAMKLIADWGKLIHEEIANPKLHRRDVAFTYRMLMEERRDTTDWRKINTAIIARWSKSALRWIKEQAHSGRCFGEVK